MLFPVCLDYAYNIGTIFGFSIIQYPGNLVTHRQIAGSDERMHVVDFWKDL